MNENTKQKRTFGEWLEDNSGKIVTGAMIVGIAGLWVINGKIYGNYCRDLEDTYNEKMTALLRVATDRINTLECKECVKAVVTEMTDEYM